MNPIQLTTIGEVLIDLTQTGADSRGIPSYVANPGGAPANVAVAAARLGAKAAQLLMRKGIRLVLVTLGAKGVYYRYGYAEGVVEGFRVPVADTNGAGDTFFGAVLARLAAREGVLRRLSERELREILRFANCAAAITTSRPGAIPAMPTMDEVRTMLREMNE